MSLKKKDLVIIGGILVIGAMIYVVLFTDLLLGPDQSQANFQSGGNSFRNFNSSVDKKPVDSTINKAAAYEAEYRKKKDQEQAAEDERVKREAAQRSDRKVDDLSKFLGKEKKAEQKQEQIKQPEEKVETLNPSSQKKEVVTPKKQNVTRTPVVTPTESQTLKTEPKKRRGDPAFGDEAANQVSEASEGSKVTSTGSAGEGLGVIHEEKKVQQNSTLKIRVTEAFKISNCEIKNNSFLTAYCRYDQAQGRMLVTITSINCNGTTTPVRIDVYDGYDNQLGLAMKEASDEQKVGKEVAGGVAEDVSDKLGIKVLKRATQSTTQKKQVPMINVLQGHKVILKEFIKP